MAFFSLLYLQYKLSNGWLLGTVEARATKLSIRIIFWYGLEPECTIMYEVRYAPSIIFLFFVLIWFRVFFFYSSIRLPFCVYNCMTQQIMSIYSEWCMHRAPCMICVLFFGCVYRICSKYTRRVYIIYTHFIHSERPRKIASNALSSSVGAVNSFLGRGWSRATGLTNPCIWAQIGARSKPNEILMKCLNRKNSINQRKRRKNDRTTQFTIRIPAGQEMNGMKWDMLWLYNCELLGHFNNNKNRRAPIHFYECLNEQMCLNEWFGSSGNPALQLKEFRKNAINIPNVIDQFGNGRMGQAAHYHGNMWI